jgi:hypothetical protein
LVAGRESGHSDAAVLANFLSTGSHAHRPLPVGSGLAQAIALLARASKKAIRARTPPPRRRRGSSRRHHASEARGILAAAPALEAAATLTTAAAAGKHACIGKYRGSHAVGLSGAAADNLRWGRRITWRR